MENNRSSSSLRESYLDEKELQKTQEVIIVLYKLCESNRMSSVCVSESRDLQDWYQTGIRVKH